jgi:transcriptional regulator with GAF, ATPase, and Fis domain
VRLPSLQRVSLALAEERSLDVILQRLVQGLVDEGLALARVWLLEPGDICGACSLPDGFVTDREFRKRERQNLLAALTEAGWKIYGRDGAAALLGMKPTTLSSRMRTLKIDRPRSTSAHRP